MELFKVAPEEEMPEAALVVTVGAGLLTVIVVLASPGVAAPLSPITFAVNVPAEL